MVIVLSAHERDQLGAVDCLAGRVFCGNLG